MNEVLGKKWWKAAGIRALRTFFQTMVASMTIGAALTEINWLNILSVSACAAVYSLCTSLAGLPEVNENEAEPLPIKEAEKDDTATNETEDN